MDLTVSGSALTADQDRAHVSNFVLCNPRISPLATYFLLHMLNHQRQSHSCVTNATFQRTRLVRQPIVVLTSVKDDSSAFLWNSLPQVE